ncbi:MAG TPA: peptidoglycan-binding domain-containing protein [Trebonia sp.]
MTDLKFYDAAYPPAKPPATDGVCIYIGGDTPHVWTRAEVDDQPARYRLPVYVRSDPARADAASDVAAAVRQLDAIGAPKRTLVAWDVETAADAAYMSAVWYALQNAGWQLIDYGSQDTVHGNDCPDGYYWGAAWTGAEHLAVGDVMTQYATFTDYDLSAALPSLPFWDTRPSALTYTEEIMQQLPTIGQGADGTAVRTAQALCEARGFTLAIDGIFGPQTKAAVMGAQRAGKVSVDGIVGPQTWPVLAGVS